jgi:shikimate dehydrogenase
MRLGLVGRDIGHSLSPNLHKAWLAERGIKGDYVLIDVPAFTPTLLDQLVKDGYRGVNVTAPYKRLAAQCVTHPDAIVRAIGVANTLKFVGDHIHACNTDAQALLSLLEPHKVSRAVVLGGGATARTSVWALQQRGCAHITLLNRRENVDIDGVEVLTRANTHAFEAVNQANVVINTLPPTATIDIDFQKHVHAGLYVQWDYMQPIPSLNTNIRTIDGRELLCEQGALSFDFWISNMLF